MGSLLQLSLLVALAAVIAVDANVLLFEQKFVPTGEQTFVWYCNILALQ